MKFQVMNRVSAREYTYQTHNHKYVIISISDVGEEDNTFNSTPELVDVLKLHFNDEEKDHPNCITAEDGQKIIDFLNKHINNVDEVVVHCSAGISRSAGVCAALMLIVLGDDRQIFDNPKFSPNMTCYRTVYTAYFGSYDEEEANRKEARSIAVWRKANGLD